MKKNLMKKGLALSMAVAIGSISSVPGVTVKAAAPETAVEGLNQYGLAERVEDGSILHCWCWSFNTIKENIPEIAAAGFSTIQTSPISECLVGGQGKLEINKTGKWYYHYQPTNYVIGNYQLGTEEEFKEMCEVAHQYGIKVIADQVLNHCTSSYSAISDDIKNGINNPFHDMSTNHWSETDRYEETQYALSGLYEWNTQNPEVQQYMLNWLKTCVDAGADGFRYDAAKLIELPDDTSEKYGNDFASDFWPIVLQNGASFQYGESLQEGGNHTYGSELKGGYDDNDSSRLAAYQSITYGEDNKHLNTTASFYGARVRDAVTGGTLNADFVGDFLMPKGASEDRVVTWVESHDNYCNDATYKELDEQQVIQAWSILSARKGGTPLFFDRPNNSSSNSPWGDNIIGPAGSDMYKDPQVVAVNFFRNEMGNAEEYLSNPTNDDNVLMIERGNAGCVIINKNDTDLIFDKASVQNMADGTYKDQAYGSEFTVKDGKISGTVRAGKVAVVYNSQIDGRLDFTASVSLSVPTKDFLTDTLDVSVSFRGCESAAYQINGGECIPCVTGEVITIGKDMKADESADLKVIGYDKDGNEAATAEATYTKRQAKGDTIIYMDGAAQSDWDDVYVYLWGNGENTSWPGVKAEKLSDGTFKYVVPYELESVWSNVIFNNGKGKQFDAGRIEPGQSMIWTADGEWISYPEPVKELPYVDVDKNDWYYDAVDYNYFQNLMAGLDEKHFGPDQYLARAQFAVILYRMDGKPETSYGPVFLDIADNLWYTDAIIWANSTGVVTGYSDTGLFGPSDSITREQMAVMMYRYAQYKKYDTSEKADFSRFSDGSSVSVFAEEAMQWAVGSGIIKGKGDGTLEPQGCAARAEGATIIQRFMEKYEK